MFFLSFIHSFIHPFKHLFHLIQRKRTKLRKEFDKEQETLRNNILRDVDNQKDTDTNERIRTLKEKHVTDVKKLKQNFCVKLEKISEAKAKWIQEEEAKRLSVQVIFLCASKSVCYIEQ